jgi:hypothetical protein
MSAENIDRIRRNLQISRETPLDERIQERLDYISIVVAQFTEAVGYLTACRDFGVVTREEYELLIQEFTQLFQNDHANAVTRSNQELCDL